MGIGDFKDKAMFYSYSSVDDGYGGKIDTPILLLETWCKVVPLSASRSISEMQLNIKGVSKFRVRWREGFVPDDKMVMEVRGLKYVIDSVVELRAEYRFWEITAVTQIVPLEILS